MNLLGKLDWNAIPLHEPIIMGATAFMVLVVVAVLGFITMKGAWLYLWREWLTSVDHKRIGVMYCILALVMMLRGFSDAIMMRAQQAVAAGGAQGYLPPEHFDQIFSAHGTIMIFFMAMPFVVGLMNFAVPLQLGIRDVAFPTLNSVSFWLTASGALLINLSLAVGEFSKAGWWGYPPLSELQYSPGVGVDYYLWSLQISGLGTLLAGINFVTTILKMRAPGMSYMRMPVFCWTSLATNLLIVAAFPVLTAVLAMLLLDRYLGFHFFTNDAGGNQMLYANLFWVWGHPEVYILVLPAFGIFSEVIATFSGKPLFGYRSMVAATMAICVLSFLVWLHHFFTMGASANVNGFFGVMSMIIALPTGVKIYNWLFTMYGGRVRFSVPVLWSIGFMVTFVIGGMTGVLHAVPPADFQLHNSVFLIAHFHNVIIGGVVFGLMAGYNYWFPKAFGFAARRTLGQSLVLVLVHRVLSRIHAALPGGPDGHDPAHAALRQSGVAALADSRDGRRRRYPGRDRLPGRAARGVDPRSRQVACDRRSMEWPHARMGDGVAAAGVEFCFRAERHRNRRFLDQQATGAGKAGQAGASTCVRADRNAEKQRHRLCQRLLRRRHRLRDDLAHLVAGQCRRVRRIRDAACLRIPQTRRIRGASRADCPVRAGSSGRSCSMNVAVAIDSVPQERTAKCK